MVISLEDIHAGELGPGVELGRQFSELGLVRLVYPTRQGRVRWSVF